MFSKVLIVQQPETILGFFINDRMNVIGGFNVFDCVRLCTIEYLINKTYW